ncbi:MAG: sugar phosphate isomerase/epimerase family protein [Armatimonadota bacterium]
MDTDWRTMMDLGLVHFMAWPDIIKDEGPIVETAEQIAADDFFGVLEVRRSENPEVTKGLKQVAEVSGLRLGVGAQPGLLLNKLSLNDLEEAGRQAAVEEVKKSVDFAAELGSPLVACLAGPDPGDADRPQAMDLLVESLVDICKHAADKGEDGPIWVSLEQFDRSYDKKSLIGPSEEAATLAYRVRDSVENFGLCVDLSHIPILDETIEDCLTAVKNDLIHIHAGNCIKRDAEHPAYGDYHPRFGHPDGENGVPELQRFLETLVYIGYFQSEVPTAKPVVTFEVKPLEGESPDLVIANAKRTFREAWAGL